MTNNTSTTTQQVTEVACLHIIEPLPPLQQEAAQMNKDEGQLPKSLLEDLSKAQKAMESSSKAKFGIYRCIEDPSILYILGSWPSVTFHRESFIPSPANQELLSSLSGRVDVRWMFHCDISVGEWDDINNVQARMKDDQDGVVIAIARHFVSSSSQRIGFQDCFDENVHELKQFIGDDGVIVGGWRVKESGESDGDAENVGGSGEEEKKDPMRLGRKSAEEFVLLTSWPSVERHYGFAQTEEFKKYAKIRDFCQLGAEIKHAQKIDLGV